MDASAEVLDSCAFLFGGFSLRKPWKDKKKKAEKKIPRDANGE